MVPLTRLRMAWLQVECWLWDRLALLEGALRLPTLWFTRRSVYRNLHLFAARCGLHGDEVDRRWRW